MSVSKISSLNNISFKENNISKPKTPKSKDEQEVKNGKTKLAFALWGLAASSIAAILIMKNKKAPSKLNIDEFKKIGKFDKGFAKIKNKPFTGTIKVPSKDGKFIIEYADGVLKQSTKFEKVTFPEHTGAKAGMLPVSRKIYSKTKNGEKIVEQLSYNKYRFSCNEKEWLKYKTVKTSNDKVVIEKINGYTLDNLQDITIKQQDGSWLKTIQEIGAFKPEGHHVLTKNAKTGEIIKDEFKAHKPITTDKTKAPKNPEQSKKERKIYGL